MSSFDKKEAVGVPAPTAKEAARFNSSLCNAPHLDFKPANDFCGASAANSTISDTAARLLSEAKRTGKLDAVAFAKLPVRIQAELIRKVTGWVVTR